MRSSAATSPTPRWRRRRDRRAAGAAHDRVKSHPVRRPMLACYAARPGRRYEQSMQSGETPMYKALCAAMVIVAGTFAGLRAGRVPPEVVKELAPTGKLRAAINYGNSVLAQKGAERRAAGHLRRPGARARPSASACRSSSSPSTPPARRSRPLKTGAWRHGVPRDRAGARRRGRLHPALCADRGHLHGAGGFRR